MKKKKEDRRIGRTRRLLHEALMGLILEKGYEAVTVQDILDRANVGRSTFYSHYRDKDELLLTGFDHLRSALENQYGSAAAGKTQGPAADFNLSLELFRHARDNHRLFKAMVGRRSGRMIMSQAHKYLTDIVRDYLAAATKGKKNSEVPVDMTAHWIAGSFFSLLTFWLDRNMPCSAETMDEMFRAMILPGLENVTGLKIEKAAPAEHSSRAEDSVRKGAGRQRG